MSCILIKSIYTFVCIIYTILYYKLSVNVYVTHTNIIFICIYVCIMFLYRYLYMCMVYTILFYMYVLYYTILYVFMFVSCADILYNTLLQYY